MKEIDEKIWYKKWRNKQIVKKDEAFLTFKPSALQKYP